MIILNLYERVDAQNLKKKSRKDTYISELTEKASIIK